MAHVHASFFKKRKRKRLYEHRGWSLRVTVGKFMPISIFSYKPILFHLYGSTLSRAFFFFFQQTRLYSVLWAVRLFTFQHK